MRYYLEGYEGKKKTPVPGTGNLYIAETLEEAKQLALLYFERINEPGLTPDEPREGRR